MYLIRNIAALTLVCLLLCTSASAQLTEARLCIHNGGETFFHHPCHGFPNQGGGKYFPSFTHWTSTPVTTSSGETVYPWKVRGWCWTGMQGLIGSPAWYWESCLQASVDNPRTPTMSWDYPVLHCTGVVPHTGAPMPIYGGSIPGNMPSIGGNTWILPSSMGGFDKYLNIFALGGASWLLPSTQPFYSYEFGFVVDCASAVTAPSGCSIWEYVWQMKGPNSQYLVASSDEFDCLGGPGNKGRNYSLASDCGGGYMWYWINGCNGVGYEWAMCILVCDAVTVPVNVPGTPNPSNPFSPYGFDVGVATITPLFSSGGVLLGFMTEDGSGIGGSRIALASFAFWPCVGPYGKMDFRIPHSFDVLTSWFLNLGSLFMHTPAPGYPGCMFGNTMGAHSYSIPIPYTPALLCAEIRYSTFATAKGAPMSASYMVTYF